MDIADIRTIEQTMLNSFTTTDRFGDSINIAEALYRHTWELEAQNEALSEIARGLYAIAEAIENRPA